ncbi:MAG: hypothetical protein HONDAALG_01707 [Gammaproteobacteria bacterium]|nr:hypothetical protein [Gammaproteobacteria bacterium]
MNFSYDAAGNMTQAGATTFGYDGAGRLKSVNGTSSTYGYDGNGGRARVTDGGAATFYVRSSMLGEVVMEVNSAGVRRAYVYAGGKLIAEQSTDGQFYYLHTNHLRSARAMTDVNGNLVYKGQFDPYGQALTEWSSSGNANLNTKKFTGYERDATGLDYANARMYNSGRGRFMTPDIKGLGSANVRRPQTLNRYAYTSNDPVNFIDRTGLDEEWWIVGDFTVTISAGGDRPIGLNHDLFDGNFLPEEGNVDGGSGGQGGGGVDFNELQRIMNEAVNLLIQRLSERPQCAQLFNNGGTSPESLGYDAVSLVQAFMNNNLIRIGFTYTPNGGGPPQLFPSHDVGAITTYGNASLPNAHGTRTSVGLVNINQGSFFMHGLRSDGVAVTNVPDAGFYGLSLREIQAAVIMHELLHATWNLPSDSNDPQQSMANSGAVRLGCF